ncbi:hypothetical protein ACX3VG_12960, partial [Escherichia coli]
SSSAASDVYKRQEQGPCARVFAAPQQEYTRQLLALS